MSVETVKVEAGLSIPAAVNQFRGRGISRLILELDGDTVFPLGWAVRDLPFSLEINGNGALFHSFDYHLRDDFALRDGFAFLRAETFGEMDLSALPRSSPTRRWLERYPLLQRAEVVTVDGEVWAPALWRSTVTEGVYHADEAGYWFPPEVVSSRVGVAQLAHVQFAGIPELTIRDVTIWGGAHRYQHAALKVNRCESVGLDHVTTVKSASKGLAVHECGEVTLDSVLVSSSGLMGVGVSRVKRLEARGLRIEENGWRAEAAGTQRWGVGGIKAMHLESGEITESTFSRNVGRGFWADTDVSGLKLESCQFVKNSLDGVDVEACVGPIDISRSLFAENPNALRLESADRVSVVSSTFRKNEVDLVVSGYGREFVKSGSGETAQSRNLYFREAGNTFEEGHPVMRFEVSETAKRNFLKTWEVEYHER